MQKAHLYEAILLVNRGIDEAVRGLERLKRAKDSGLKAGPPLVHRFPVEKFPYSSSPMPR